MNTASEAVSFMRAGLPLTTGQKLLNMAVNKSGAVSPAARATASITPVRMPGMAVGISDPPHDLCGVAPMPIAASRILAGTMRMASSAVRITRQHQERQGHATGQGREMARHQHHHLVGEHAGQDRRKTGEHLGRETHGLGQAALGPDLGQEDRRQHAQGHGDEGGDAHHDDRAQDGVAEAAALVHGRRRQ